MRSYWLDSELWADRPMVLDDILKLVQCHLCNEWIDWQALDIHLELKHGYPLRENAFAA